MGDKHLPPPIIDFAHMKLPPAVRLGTFGTASLFSQQSVLRCRKSRAIAFFASLLCVLFALFVVHSYVPSCGAVHRICRRFCKNTTKG